MLFNISKKKILLICVGLIGTIQITRGQDVVKAENDFADYVKSHSIKSAFLRFMANDAVAFIKGGDTVNAAKFWQKVPEGSDIMVWQPAFYATSKAADLAFTTGPYIAKPSINGEITGFGQYTTIWKKDKNGEWKFLLDMGTNILENQFAEKIKTSEFNPYKNAKKDTSSALGIENDFIKQYKTAGINVYKQYLTKNSWFNIPKTNPLTENNLIIEALGKQPNVEFEPIKGYMSASKDLAFVYGKTISQNRKLNYLRIWAYTKDGWKILLQVLK